MCGWNTVLFTLKTKLFVEDSLIALGIYTHWYENIVLVPKVIVDDKTESIRIKVPNPWIMNKLQSAENVYALLLPEKLELARYGFSRNKREIVLEYNHLEAGMRYIFKNSTEFIQTVKTLPYAILLIDKKTSLNLAKNPQTLVSGKTGSGKSYFTYSVIFQAIIKKWEVQIIDYKRSYQAFKRYCSVSFTIEEIKTALQEAVDELHRRQKEMDSILHNDPSAIAIEHGYPIRFIVIEEYLALVNSGIDKKTLQEIEKMILELTTLGRSLGIHVYMVLQVSSADNLNTSIRSNMTNKLVFGTNSSTVYATAFGVGNVPPVISRMEQGEGIGTFDVELFTFRAPSFEFEWSELFEIMLNSLN